MLFMDREAPTQVGMVVVRNTDRLRTAMQAVFDGVIFTLMKVAGLTWAISLRQREFHHFQA